MADADKGVAERSMVAISAGGDREGRPDRVVVEEPLEIRVAGESMAITMRTPGSDSDLALGFLFAEGVISGVADVGRVAHCGRPGDDGYGNTIDVLPGPGVVLEADRLEYSRRGTLTTSACGVCGRRSIDDLLSRISSQPQAPKHAVTQAAIVAAIGRLRSEQRIFERTGAIHAAAAFSAAGALVAAAEDVGRHNAVDKVVGAMLRTGAIGRTGPETPLLLITSGRASFEIVQKAAVAQLSVVAAVSAPTSLAVDLADRAGITLAGFVREGRMNVYSHADRVIQSAEGSIG